MQPCPFAASPQTSLPTYCGLGCRSIEGDWRRDPRDPQMMFLALECPVHGRWYLQVLRMDMKGEQHV